MSTGHEHSNPGLDCARAQQLLGSREALSGEDEARVREHVGSCPRCQAVSSWVPEVDRLAATLPSSPPPDAYFTRLRQRVLDEASRDPAPPSAPVTSRWRRWARTPVLAPAGVVVILALGVLTVQQWRQEPVDVVGPGSANVAPRAVNQAPEESAHPADAVDQKLSRTGGSQPELADAPPREPAPRPPQTGSPGDRAQAEQLPSLLLGKDEMLALDEPAPASTAKLESPPRLEGDDALRVLLVTARAEAGLPSEDLALRRLLDGLESQAPVPGIAARGAAPGPSPAEEYARTMPRTQLASPRRARSTSEEPDRDAALAPIATVVDSATAHLRARLDHVRDEALRGRIESYLRDWDEIRTPRE